MARIIISDVSCLPSPETATMKWEFRSQTFDVQRFSELPCVLVFGREIPVWRGDRRGTIYHDRYPIPDTIYASSPAEALEIRRDIEAKLPAHYRPGRFSRPIVSETMLHARALAEKHQQYLAYRMTEARKAKLDRAADRGALTEFVENGPALSGSIEIEFAATVGASPAKWAVELDEDEWRDLWDRHQKAGGELPMVAYEEAGEEYGDGMGWNSCTYSALGEKYTVPSEACYGGDSPGYDMGNGGYGWSASRPYGDCASGSEMVHGLILAHGDSPDGPGVAEPSQDDIATDGKPYDEESVYFIADGEVREAKIQIYRHPGTDYDAQEDTEDSFPVAVIVDGIESLAGETFDSIAQSRKKIEREIDGEIYESESDADSSLQHQLAERLTDEVSDPAGMTVILHDEDEHSDGWLSIRPDDDDEWDGETYHLDTDEIRQCLHAGSYAPIMDAVQEAFGTRAALAALRERNEQLDEWLGEHPVFVGVDDSLRSGNCRGATEELRRTFSSEAGAEIGAVRSDFLLSRRDDMYTRRAVRMAAVRAMSH